MNMCYRKHVELIKH